MSKPRVGIVGAAGYTGGELLRILLAHPEVEIAFAQSTSHMGQPWHAVHRDLLGYTDAKFTPMAEEADVLFLCQGHGAARRYLQENPPAPGVKLIDLSQDFRHAGSSTLRDRHFIYGLPEHRRDAIRQADSVANPGCFATAIQLALLPLATQGWLPTDVHVQATTGSTGAGQALSETGHFSRRSNNLSVYKAFDHQHLQEIGETLADAGSSPRIHFVPMRGAFSRGILATATVQTDIPQADIEALYRDYYQWEPFTVFSPYEVELKTVVNTNFCYLGLERVGDQLLIVSAIDNLLKGASGQAVQNMNLMLGLPEKTGLLLKPSAY